MLNQYNKNRKSDEGVDFYLPIGAILVELQDCSNIIGIESDTTIDPAIATPVYSCQWDNDNQQWICYGEHEQEEVNHSNGK
jgi:hypothetical protein